MYDCKKTIKSLSQNAIFTINMKKQELLAKNTKNDTKKNIKSNFIGYNVSNTVNLIHSQALSEKTLQKSKNYYKSGNTIRKYDKIKFLKYLEKSQRNVQNGLSDSQVEENYDNIQNL